MPVGWRIFRTKYSSASLSGDGARRDGGRWNRTGVPVVYLADSLPLAVLEILVRLQHVGLLSGFSQARVDIPDRAVETIDRKDLPQNWRTSPRPEALVAIGERWVREARTAVLAVPSALLPSDKNFVMNPAHRDFGRVRVGPIEPLDLDPRLLRPSI